MSLSLEEVKKVAKLARIELTEAEETKFQQQLSEILAYVERLQAVDTAGVVETSQVTGLENVWREDVVDAVSEATRQAALNEAPELEENLIKVKSVFN